MALAPEQDRELREELDRFAALIAMNDDQGQERILDHVFLLIGLDPTWEDWLPYARVYLPAYRHEPEGEQGAHSITDHTGSPPGACSIQR